MPNARPTATAILLVEDNPGDAELIRVALDDAMEDEHVALPGDACVIHDATCIRDARRVLAETRVDVVLLDLTLPDARGLESLAQMRAASPHLPIVVLTGIDDEALAMRALRAGAQDYLVKGAVNGAGVWRAVRRAVERQHLVESAHRATHDRDVVLGIVAHDLRNPLGAIKMCAAAMLATDAPSADAVHELAGVMRTSAELMERIIRDLLDVSAIEAGQLAMDVRPTALHDVLATAFAQMEPIAVAQGVMLRVIGSGTDPLCVDAERLQQALGNVLGNAIKFTAHGGTVTLRASIDASAQVAELIVEDTGCGIAPEHLPHVFDRFWQARETRRAGAGLGLAIAKGIVEAHGGTIAVTSTVDVGTRFTITVPTRV